MFNARRDHNPYSWHQLDHYCLRTSKNKTKGINKESTEQHNKIQEPLDNQKKRGNQQANTINISENSYLNSRMLGKLELADFICPHLQLQLQIPIYASQGTFLAFD